MTRSRTVYDLSTNPPTVTDVPFTPEEEAAADAAAAAAVAVTGDMVDAERDRRIALPLTVDLGDGRSIAVNMDNQALRNMNGLATGAVLAKMTGSSTTQPFITYANDLVQLSPDDLIALGLQVQARISAITFKGRDLKDMSPIPADYTADAHWQD